MTETALDWWITTNFLRKGGEKVMGPFVSRELAMEVRTLRETVDGGRCRRAGGLAVDEVGGVTTASKVRFDFTVTLDLKAWADEYGMTVTEARQALNSTAREAVLDYLERNGFPAEATR